MSYRNLILMTMVFLVIGGCVKHGGMGLLKEETALDLARQYFTDSVLSSDALPASYVSRIPRKVHWELASPVKLPIGKGVVVPLEYGEPLFVKAAFAGDHFFHLDNLTQLFVYRDKAKLFHAEVLTWMPDSNFLAAPMEAFSGYLFVDDWWGRRISSYRYGHGQVRKYHEVSTQAATVIQICTVIYGYNYAEGDPEDGYAWQESGGCDVMYFPDIADYGSGGGSAEGGGGIPHSSRTPIIFVGHNLITNIKAYFQCFQNVAGASYNVKVCVSQPEPGTRTPWTFSLNDNSSSGTNAVNVGHTFLIFSENFNGNMVTRNIGFYPSTDVSPFTTSIAQGALNDDEGHSYNISASFEITPSLFFNMLNYASQGSTPGYNYNLSTNNCTTFAINTLSEGHIYLPSTIGSWFGGVGNDPGDLGEDIRNSHAPGIVKSTTEVPHANAGSCN